MRRSQGQGNGKILSNLGSFESRFRLNVSTYFQRLHCKCSQGSYLSRHRTMVMGRQAAARKLANCEGLSDIRKVDVDKLFCKTILSPL
jgi:hypothetical protein